MCQALQQSQGGPNYPKGRPIYFLLHLFCFALLLNRLKNALWEPLAPDLALNHHFGRLAPALGSVVHFLIKTGAFGSSGALGPDLAWNLHFSCLAPGLGSVVHILIQTGAFGRSGALGF